MPAKLPYGLASDFHIGFPPWSGFEADTTWFELQNPADGFLTLLGGLQGRCEFSGGARPRAHPEGLEGNGQDSV